MWNLRGKKKKQKTTKFIEIRLVVTRVGGRRNWRKKVKRLHPRHSAQLGVRSVVRPPLTVIPLTCHLPP